MQMRKSFGKKSQYNSQNRANTTTVSLHKQATTEVTDRIYKHSFVKLNSISSKFTKQLANPVLFSTLWYKASNKPIAELDDEVECQTVHFKMLFFIVNDLINQFVFNGK